MLGSIPRPATFLFFAFLHDADVNSVAGVFSCRFLAPGLLVSLTSGPTQIVLEHNLSFKFSATRKNDGLVWFGLMMMMMMKFMQDITLNQLSALRPTQLNLVQR